MRRTLLWMALPLSALCFLGYSLPAGAFFGVYNTLLAHSPQGSCQNTARGIRGLSGTAKSSWRQAGSDLFLSRTIQWSDGTTGTLDGRVSRDGSANGDPLTIAMHIVECKGW